MNRAADNESWRTTVLVEAAANGDPAAAGRLIQQYDPYIRACVRRRLGDERCRSDGEDILQVIRLAIFRNVTKLETRDQRTFKAWLRKVIHSHLAKLDRAPRGPRPLRTSEEQSLPAREETPSQVLSREEDIEKLRRAIDQVPVRYREVLLFIVGRLPLRPCNDELASFVKKSPEAARKFVFRGLEHLKNAVSGLSGGAAGPEGDRS